MQSDASSSPLHPALLPLGTQLGPWRVVDWAGRGVHGAVYRAVRIGQEHLPPVALKLALLPEDPRFERERELLSRTLHPHIPRLVDHGSWQSPSGSLHPFVAMEWVDGVPLYDWARLFRPSAAQQLRLLALTFRHTSERYRAGPADDVFALGVTACVLATGLYPELGEPRRDAQGTWHLESLVLPRALFSAQVAAPLRELILRMLSLRPEQRGSAAELAPALEQAADLLTPIRLLPSASGPEPTAVHSAEAPVSSPRAPVHSLPPWIALAVAAGALATWAGWMTRAALLQAPEGPRLASEAARPTGSQGSPDAGPVGLGEAAASTATPGPAQPSTSEPLAADSPPEPFEGQAQPDKKGRCPRPQHVILNGSCWGPLELKREKCEDVSGQMYQGVCYVPILPPGSKRPTTSSPGNPR